jgi:hypothetical protein
MQERLQALARTRGNRLFPELLPWGDRLTIRLQKPPAVDAIGDVRLQGLPLAGIEGAFQVRQDEIHYIPTAQHRRGASSVMTSAPGFSKPLLHLDYQLCLWLHAEVCLLFAK